MDKKTILNNMRNTNKMHMEMLINYNKTYLFDTYENIDKLNQSIINKNKIDVKSIIENELLFNKYADDFYNRVVNFDDDKRNRFIDILERVYKNSTVKGIYDLIYTLEQNL